MTLLEMWPQRQPVPPKCAPTKIEQGEDCEGRYRPPQHVLDKLKRRINFDDHVDKPECPMFGSRLADRLFSTSQASSSSADTGLRLMTPPTTTSPQWQMKAMVLGFLGVLSLIRGSGRLPPPALADTGVKREPDLSPTSPTLEV